MWLPLQGQILRSLPLKGHIMCSRTWKSLNTSFGISLCVITVCLLEKLYVSDFELYVIELYVSDFELYVIYGIVS